MSNTSRGVMKIPTNTFGSQAGLTGRVSGGNTAGVAYETVSHMIGVEQLDLLDDEHALIIARNDAGVASLQSVALTLKANPPTPGTGGGSTKIDAVS